MNLKIFCRANVVIECNTMDADTLSRMRSAMERPPREQTAGTLTVVDVNGSQILVRTMDIIAVKVSP